MAEKIKELLEKFRLVGQLEAIFPIEVGHINETYKIKMVHFGKPSHYILQKINTNIFKQPEQVMDNIIMVGQFLREKKYPKEILMPVQSHDQQYYVKNQKAYWRLFPFIEDTITYNKREQSPISFLIFHII